MQSEIVDYDRMGMIGEYCGMVIWVIGLCCTCIPLIWIGGILQIIGVLFPLLEDTELC